MSISLTSQIQEVEREIALRRNVYPRSVSAGKMKHEVSLLLIERMESVLKTLLWLQKHEAAIRAAVDLAKGAGAEASEQEAA